VPLVKFHLDKQVIYMIFLCRKKNFYTTSLPNYGNARSYSSISSCFIVKQNVLSFSPWTNEIAVKRV